MTSKSGLLLCFQNKTMFPLWFGLLGGSFVFLDVWVLPFCSLYSPFFGCFGLFFISRVSSSNKVKKERKMFLLSILFVYMVQEKW